MRKRLCPTGSAHAAAAAQVAARHHRGTIEASGQSGGGGRDGGGAGGVRVRAVREAGGARVPGTAAGLQPRLQVGPAPARGVSAPPGLGGFAPSLWVLWGVPSS